MTPKQKYQKKKKRKKILCFLKEYAAVITIFMSIVAVLFNAMISYYQKAKSTTFIEEYFSIRIDEKFPTLSENSAYYITKMKYPTLNNEIAQIIKYHKQEVEGYSVTYLLLTQSEKIGAKDVVVTLEKRGFVDMNHLENHQIDLSKKERVTEKVSLQISQDEGIKIPISICKIDEINNKKYDCQFLTYKPLCIEYRNKYLFSKQKMNIRDENVGNFMIDGFIGEWVVYKNLQCKIIFRKL